MNIQEAFNRIMDCINNNVTYIDLLKSRIVDLEKTDIDTYKVITGLQLRIARLEGRLPND